MKLKSITLLIILCMSLFLAGCSSTQSETTLGYSPEFIELFEAELQNRAVARKVTASLSDNPDHPERAQFWQAYYALEQVNQPIYAAVAAQYQLDTEAGFMANSKALFSDIAFGLFPETMEKSLHGAVADYLPKLQRIHELAPKEHEAFFAWAVLQEQAQLDAFAAVVKSNYLGAAEILNNTRPDAGLLSAAK